MSRALRIYGRVVALLPPGKRSLVDLPRRSFNFLALYLFMRCVRHGNDGRVALPETIPTAPQVCYSMRRATPHHLLTITLTRTPLSPPLSHLSLTLSPGAQHLTAAAAAGRPSTRPGVVSSSACAAGWIAMRGRRRL